GRPRGQLPPGRERGLAGHHASPPAARHVGSRDAPGRRLRRLRAHQHLRLAAGTLRGRVVRLPAPRRKRGGRPRRARRRHPRLRLSDARSLMDPPALVDRLVAGVLLPGLLAGRPLLTPVLGEGFGLAAERWRKLSARWALFFLALASLNEVVGGNFSEAFWVN